MIFLGLHSSQLLLVKEEGNFLQATKQKRRNKCSQLLMVSKSNLQG